MAVADHPDPGRLAAFARGQLPPDDLTAVADHVTGCPSCCEALGQLPPDSLAALLAGGTPAAAVKPPPPDAAPPGVPPALADHPRYKVQSELGAGGMGVVYKAEHRIMGRTVALKVMAPHLTAKANAVGRFRREVTAAAKLAHPNIVTAHDADEAGGLHFLVMEFVEGISLDRLVARKGRLAVPMACQFARQAALGLQHAADKGMVHRDIKPQNLMVTRKGQLKILDFGLARFAAAPEPEEETAVGGKPAAPPSASATAPDVVMGTPDYLSPEQARSAAVDARSDVYSLGCTLYFLLAGRVPFPHGKSVFDKLIAHTQEDPTPLTDLRSDVPPGVAAAVARMMAKRPDDRFQTAAEAAAALAPFTKAADPQATAEVVDAVVVAPPAAGGARRAAVEEPAFREPAAERDTADDTHAERTLSEHRPRRRKKRRPAKSKPPTALWVGLAVAGLAVGAGTWLLATRGRTPSPSAAAPPTSAAAPAVDRTRGVPPPGPGGAAAVTPAADPDRGVPVRPTPAATPAAGRAKTVLFVLPSDGLLLADYRPVRERLEARGIRAVTATGAGGPAALWRTPGNDGEPVPADVKLTEGMDLSGYDGVVFVGAQVDEYLPPKPPGHAGGGPGGPPGGPGGKGPTPPPKGKEPPPLGGPARAAKFVTAQMSHEGKVVAGICAGTRVLAVHRMLEGRRAAKSPPAVEARTPWGPPEWVDEPAVTDVSGGRPLVTARGPDDAGPFADAVADLLLAK